VKGTHQCDCLYFWESSRSQRKLWIRGNAKYGVHRAYPGKPARRGKVLDTMQGAAKTLGELRWRWAWAKGWRRWRRAGEPGGGGTSRRRTWCENKKRRGGMGVGGRGGEEGNGTDARLEAVVGRGQARSTSTTVVKRHTFSAFWL